MTRAPFLVAFEFLFLGHFLNYYFHEDIEHIHREVLLEFVNIEVIEFEVMVKVMVEMIVEVVEILIIVMIILILMLHGEMITPLVR
jgi:hypothetical protein